MLPEMRRAAFTLIELLVTIGIIAVLMGIMIPALAGAREQARATRCGVNLSQLGVAMTMYIPEHKGWLPQVRADFQGNVYPPGSTQGGVIGSLFGGKRGALPIYGVNRVGADERPLNAYLGKYGPDDEVEVFRDPSDSGTSDPGLAYLQQQLGLTLDTTNMYDLIGTSYNLNDHALDTIQGQDAYPTLVPGEGGRMPDVVNPSRTWMLGDQPIYNYEDGGDRGQRWHNGRVLASLLFVDAHVDITRPVPPGEVNTTKDYTFLPSPDWLGRYGVASQ